MWEQFDLISIRDEPNHGVISILDDNIDWVGVWGGFAADQ